jgi:hypothetical protein
MQNIISSHKYTDYISQYNYDEICIADFCGNSWSGSAMIELFFKEDKYFMYVEEFDNVNNKHGKYWKELTEEQVIAIINAYDNDDNIFINNIYNDMDTNTYKDLSCEQFCEFLGIEIIN